MPQLRVGVCVKEKDRKRRSCEECDSVNYLFCPYTDEVVERSHTSPSALGVKTWQTPDRDSPITKQVTENTSNMILLLHLAQNKKRIQHYDRKNISVCLCVLECLYMSAGILR